MNSDESGKQACASGIAWQGWSLRTPGDWRPLKISGDRRRGSMMIGNVQQAILLVEWWRPGKGFNPDNWFRERFREIGAVPSPDAPAPPGFDRAEWVRDFERKQGDNKTLWYGYSQAGAVLIECAVGGAVEKRLQRWAHRHVLPSLRVSLPGTPCRWSLYSVGFVSPPDFYLRRHHLFSGDIALQFVNKRADSLLLRQVYPAGLALQRRTLERWLEACPFKEHRRFSPESLSEWEHQIPRTLTGIRRRGWKRLPAPLGFCSPRYSCAIAAADAEVDRVLIAESLGKPPADDGIVREAILNMNT